MFNPGMTECPPSTCISSPVVHRDSSDASHRTASLMARGGSRPTSRSTDQYFAPWRSSFTPCPGPLPEHRRSEEHTSELQSLMRISYAVFCLKQQTITYNSTPKELPKKIP